MAIKVETVGELIAVLGKFAPETPIEATWEGIFRDIGIYRGKKGQCILDADELMYEEDFSDGSL